MGPWPSRERQFNELFQRSWQPVRAYVLRRTSEPATADDVVAEVFLVAWRRFSDVPSDRDLPWLYGVARNVLLNVKRGEARRGRLVRRLTAHVLVDSQEGPEAVGLEHEKLERLRDALGELDENELEALRLATWERLSHAEMAVVMDCSVNAVGIRLYRARKKLAKMMLMEQPSVPSPLVEDSGFDLGARA